MDSAAFTAAQQSYNAGDWANAYIGLKAIADDAESLAPGESGQVNHLIGNCLLRLNRTQESIDAYKAALSDAAYGKLGAVHSNLGMALINNGQYEEAVTSFEAALNDRNYATPYKAFMGIGSALLKLGHPTDAGIAYRRAAMDQRNPYPGKALMNLGVCFMAINRPSDAIDTYIAALELESRPQARNQICANLGQAYNADGRYMEAISAFEQAVADGTYRLSDQALADYANAQSAGIFASQISKMPYEAYGQGAVAAGATGVTGATGVGYPVSGNTGVQNALSTETQQAEPVMPDPGDSGFFTATEQEILQQVREEKTLERKRKHTGRKVFLTILVIIVLLAALAAFGYMRGYGYPSSQTVVENLFAYAGTSGVSQYWDSSVDSSKVSHDMQAIVQGTQPTVQSTDVSMSGCVAHVQATLPEGGIVYYDVSMARDGITYKVTSVTLTYQSMQ